ncbi:MAG: hypothetical protein JST81_11600 [Bacteroidetes bacterium]|nr:hypothetical protein [Bacteroidota bacterium]
MKIKTKITFKEYRNLLFGLTYKKGIMKFILFVAALMMCWILGYYLHFLPLPKPEIYQYITLLLILIVQPVTIFLTIKRNYYSSNHLKEQLELELTKNELKMFGESFYTEIKWDKFFKIVEQKSWFLMYQNNRLRLLFLKRICRLIN